MISVTIMQGGEVEVQKEGVEVERGGGEMIISLKLGEAGVRKEGTVVMITEKDGRITEKEGWRRSRSRGHERRGSGDRRGSVEYCGEMRRSRSRNRYENQDSYICRRSRSRDWYDYRRRRSRSHERRESDGSKRSMSWERGYSGYDYRDGGWRRNRSRSCEMRGSGERRGRVEYHGKKRYDRSKSKTKSCKCPKKYDVSPLKTQKTPECDKDKKQKHYVPSPKAKKLPVTGPHLSKE